MDRVVTPRLRQRYGLFTTGLIVGFLWGAWHFIVAFWGSGTASGAFSLLLFLPQFLFYVTVVSAYRMLMVWVYDCTESLLVAMLMHASLTGCVLFIFMPLTLSGIFLLIWYLALATVLWIFVAAVAVANRRSPEWDIIGRTR
jgi:membrane protease YdiL (CAAX protease family)